MTTIVLSLLAGTLSGTVTDGSRPVADAVVYVSGGAEGKPGHAVIEQKGKKFIPHVLAITKGSSVDFPNEDHFYHNVFAEYNAKKFDLGMYPSGSSKTVKFDKPGVVSLLCNMHSEMSAYIYVVETPYFAVTDRHGHFSISGVPAGSHIAVWHESRRTGSATWSGSGELNITIKR